MQGNNRASGTYLIHYNRVEAEQQRRQEERKKGKEGRVGVDSRTGGKKNLVVVLVGCS